MRHAVTLIATVAGTTAVALMGCIGFQVESDGLVDPAYEASAGAKLVVTGDFNGDGLPDLASIADESQQVQIHLRMPGTNNYETYTIAGGSPLTRVADLEPADLNRDGKLDLVVLAEDTGLAESSDQGALVFLVQGANPTIAANWTQTPRPGEQIPSNISFDGAVSDLVIGDMDGLDGPDVVVITDEDVRLFDNPGDASVSDRTAWIPTVIETTVVEKGRVSLADLDADGDQDVVVCDPGAQSFNLRWLQNPIIEQGGIEEVSFPTYMSDEVDPLFESTAGAKAVTVGDINGDGLDDVASVSDENQPVQIHLRNATTGKFDTYSIAGGGPLALMIEIALADFNNDGKLDIAVLAADTGFVPPLEAIKAGAAVVLLQGADPTRPEDWTQVDPPFSCYGDQLGDECNLIFPSSDVGATDMEVADFTGDGLPDIAVASNEIINDDNRSVFIHVLINPGVASVSDPALWTRVEAEENVVDLARIGASDLDNDGDLDLIMSQPEAKTWNLSWARNNGNGSEWTFGGVGKQNEGGDFIAVGDIDGDGYDDVAVASIEFMLVQWFRNPGPPPGNGQTQVPWDVFNIGEVEVEDDEDEISQLQLVDLDGDGQLDCFVTAGPSAFGFLRQDDVEHVWDVFDITTTDPPKADIGRVAFDDFDGDGLLDFLAPLDREGLTEDRIIIYTSVSSSEWHRRLVGQQEGGADYLDVGDIDGDGNPDVVAGSVDFGLTQWFRNPGPSELVFGAAQVPWAVFNVGMLADLEFEGEINQVQLVDFEGDGKLECFMSASGYAFEYRSNLFNVEQPWSGSAVFKTDPAGIIGPAQFVDVNGNGWMDIVAPIDREGLSEDQIIIFER